ncbi:hypothetical protein L873DRAFT_315520 [Choiromyces venosus 120613-1]|uniref:Uncharacterized protein n=1 Tax=Choiromyces venosus 120613-1 TaxID=1336337 RepID=A0A3N4J2S6_9PEZI|nr:hypothetical protein L873DRAFT_315520 [Choiromyces venosus 120613-1]
MIFCLFLLVLRLVLMYGFGGEKVFTYMIRLDYMCIAWTHRWPELIHYSRYWRQWSKERGKKNTILVTDKVISYLNLPA